MDKREKEEAVIRKAKELIESGKYKNLSEWIRLTYGDRQLITGSDVYIINKLVDALENQLAIRTTELEINQKEMINVGHRLIVRAETAEKEANELKEIKDYMGVAYPIFKKALQDCIKEVELKKIE